VRILFIGDIVGRPGRRAVRELLPALRSDYAIELTVANGENAAAGFGITAKVVQEILEAGVDVITTGNHVWNKKEAEQVLAQQPRVLRPANYPPDVPGAGSGVYQAAGGQAVAVLNLCGRTFMDPMDCPFRVGRAEVERLRQTAPVVLVDMHAEATSEKLAMVWYLDGEVSAVIGSHTHVATADARVTPGGTAAITDLGMTGPRDSILGVEPQAVLRRFVTRMPVKFNLAKGPVLLSGVVVDVDEASGLARGIERIERTVGMPDTEPAAESENT
jgi:metallophosphoesterase (TIGR00282 family)